MVSRILFYCVGVAALLAAFPTPSQAQPVSSHMNQDIVDHIMLVAAPFPDAGNLCHTSSFKEKGFFQVFPDGTRSPTVFQVPSGHFLVVTDVEWSAYGGPNGTSPLQPGRTLRMFIFLSPIVSQALVFQSRGVTLDADTAKGRPGTSEQLTTGFVVGPEATICPTVSQSTPTFLAAVFINSLILRGYLIKE